MANFVSQVKLPNNTTYTIRDPNARPLSNNDFDTINVTELNAGDLIVTGGARFLNTINGDISGNSATATKFAASKTIQTNLASTSAASFDGSANVTPGVTGILGVANGGTGKTSGIDAANFLLNSLTTGSSTPTDNDYYISQYVGGGTTTTTYHRRPMSALLTYIKGNLGTAAQKNYTTSVTSGSPDLVTSGAVWTAIDNLPEPMVFKGSLGTGGTITDLPVNGSASIGDTYKVIEAKTYAGKTAKIGDTFICLTKTSSANTWELIPSGDEPSGTVTSVAISNGGGLSVSGSPITSSGTITISHSDTSSQASVSNSGRTYIQSITLDTYGHVTKLTSATETVTNTDRYVNSAAFAHDSTNDNVKMTLTRAGSDTATVTAYIPKVSSSSSGVVPKGATVSSQSQTTKFLREDGTWAVPSYTPVIDNLTSSTSTTSALSAKQGYLLANGSARDNTKLPLAGGTMTGQIVLASSALKTNESAGWTMNQYGNLVHQRETTTDYWAIANNAGTYKLQVYYETGAVTAAGNVTAPRFIGTADYAASMAEANLTWGGKNFSAGYGCIDAALMDELGANRLQFIKADAITVEYTRDGGTTWTDYGATDAQKKQIFAQGGSLIIGKADSTNKATEHPGLYQLRVTIDTGVAGIYTVLNKFVILVSSTGSANCACKIQKALQSTPTAFVDHTDWISIAGWSGYNVLNVSSFATYGNSSSSQYGRVRFIFKDGEGGSTSYNGLVVNQIKGFGGVGWITPSTMAKTGHLYSYNENQDAIFPNTVQAPYHRATTKMTLSSGKISQITTGHTMLFADGIAISNPATANDQGWIRVLGTGESDTIMEIATGDDGGAGEQIVVRQYNTSSTITNEATLLDKSGNTTFPKNVTATKFIGALQGNADTATTATTATNLSGFTNTTTSRTAIDSATQNGHVYVTGTSGIYSQNDGAAFVQAYSTSWVAQIYQDYRTGQIALRGKNNGTWQSWRKVWDSVNLTSKTAAASGTDLSLVTTGEKATWNAKGSGTITSVKTTAGAHTTINVTSGAANFNVPTKTSHLTNDSGFVTQDTKNTAGSTDTSSKIFLIGATSQAANPQTYSQDTAYVGTDGCLYSGGTKVLTAHQDISGKVSKTGDTMSGALTVEASNSYSSYNEGIRINAGARTYATLLMGGTNGTTSGTNDGAFWLGVYNTGTTARRLMIAHNGSTNTGTYFYASSSSDISPSLRVGSNLQVANVISANVSNSGTAGGISLYSTDPTSYGIAMRGTGNGGKHGAVQGDWAIYSYMNGNNSARGWIWRNSYGNNYNLASLDVYGNAVFNGYVGIGGNETNTSGVRQVYNETTKSLDFVFVA